MKRTYVILLCLLSCICGLRAQNTINFQAVPPVEGDMSAEVSKALKLKVEQILTRNGAAATSLYNAFVVEPQLNLLDQMSTEGLIRNVNVVKAELTLLAKNALDGSMYGSIVVPVAGSGKGSMDQTLRSLISAIRVTDAQYTRFIRNARQKIMDHYTQNCGTIMQKAQVMMNTGKYEDAVAYLSCVPETTPCYEQAAEALIQASGMAKNLDCEAQLLVAKNHYIRHEYDKALDVLAKIPMSSPCNEAARALTDSVEKYINVPPEVVEIEKIVEKEVIKEVPVEKVVVKEVPVEKVVEKVVVKEVPVAVPVPTTPTPTPAPKPAALNPKITYSRDDLEIKINSCVGKLNGETIELDILFINKNRGNENYSFNIREILDEEGNVYPARWHSYRYSNCNRSLPYDMPIKHGFTIEKVYKKISKIAYIKINFEGSQKIEIKDLPVTWK